MLNSNNDLENADRERGNEWLEESFRLQMEQWEESRTPSLSIMVTKGTLDWAYPPFIIGSTAAALDWKVTVFFTFYGLALLKKDLHLRLSGLGNPAMPMKMPFGPKRFRDIEWQVPNFVMAGVPGFERAATSMMEKTLKDHGVAPVAELRSLCVEAGVKFIGCQMTRDLFGWADEAFIPDVSEWAGAATYLSVTQASQVNLYM